MNQQDDQKSNGILLLFQLCCSSFNHTMQHFGSLSHSLSHIILISHTKKRKQPKKPEGKLARFWKKKFWKAGYLGSYSVRATPLIRNVPMKTLSGCAPLLHPLHTLTCLLLAQLRTTSQLFLPQLPRYLQHSSKEPGHLALLSIPTAFANTFAFHFTLWHSKRDWY